jgi:hypothetical protein
VIVAVVVTVITEGAAAGTLTAALGDTAGTIAAGAIGGAAGSIASQAVGNAIGVQDGFSWSAVALGALGGAVSAGVGGIDTPDGAHLGGISSLSGPSPAMAIARGAISSALTQGIGVAVGLQDHFSWTGVAASAIGAGVGAAVGNAGPSMFGSSPMGQFATRVTAGLAAGTTTAVLRGGKINAAMIAADAFGNALGSSLSAANGQQTGSNSSSDDPLGALIALNGGWAGVSATPSFAEDHAARAAALNPGGLPTYSAATVEDGLNARNGSDVQDDLYVAQNGPGRASTRLNVQSGNTVEGLAKQVYGDDWRAGVAVLMSANNLRTNQWGSPMIRAEGTLLAPSLDGLSDEQLGVLATSGGKLEANNANGLNQKAQLEAQAAQQAAQAASNYNVNYGNEGRNYFLSGAGAKLDYQQQVYNAQETYRFGANSAALQASAQATADWNDAAINASLGDANPMAYQLESDSTRGKFITGFGSALWKGATELPLEVTDTVTAAWNVLTGDDKYVGYSMLGQKAMGGASSWELTGDVVKNAVSVFPLVGATRAAYNLTEAMQNGDPEAAGGGFAGLAGSFVAAKAMGYDTTAIVSDGLRGPMLSQRGAIANFRLEPLYENQLPGSLASELTTARSNGIGPISPVGPEFDAAINQGTIKYAVTASGDLLVIPKFAADGTEISHAVITGGKPVIAAGEAEIAGNRQDGYIGADINEHSGHFMNGNTAAQNAAVIARAKSAFAKYGIGF